VKAAIEVKRKDRNYYCSADPSEMSDEQWIKRINAAKLLSDLFGELSTNRVPYKKVIHSVDLTRWLLEHSPQDLREVADLLANALCLTAAPSEAETRRIRTSTVAAALGVTSLQQN
jgi:hypothetical protein